ncbi:MAG TPA: ATP-binding protein [Anaeromyxobacteraceae bacterium]|nr:ATP-binding protein [Anaeromyxobacteraceae bacterium]
MPARKLSPEDLCRRCDASRLEFRTTAELEDLDLPLGQDRAAEAIRFGTAIRQDGYNVFALGPPGVGKESLVSRVVGRRAAGEPTPSDWCYLYNFEDRHRPRAVELPAGRAVQFRADMQKLVEELRVVIPAVFEGEEYRTRLSVLEKQLEEKREEAMKRVQEHAREKGIAVVRTPMGIALAPTRDGEVLDPEKFQKLPAEEQQRIQRDMAALQEELGAAMRSVPQLEREHRERVKEMNKEVALFAAGHLIDDVRKGYADLKAVLSHLEAVQQDVVENVRDFLGSGEEDAAAQIRKLFAETPSVQRYGVNVMVDHSGATGAPVVTEDLPTHPNLVGRIEHHAHFGTLVTDFTLIRPGAFHRANGGYLILDARKVLTQAFAWDDLKRALRAREIRIESPERLVGLSGAASLEPEPIPLQAKVVLTGERFLYHLLSAYDPDFLELFKVAADFEDQIDRGDGNEMAYARLVATLARAEALRPFDREAVARVVEHGARLAGDGEKLSAHLQGIGDLLREADHLAGEAGRQAVSRADVQAAIDGRIRRSDRVRQRLLEEIGRGTILIDTAGAAVGQVNGLSVYQLGQHAFGSPSRITARVRMGKGEVVDIEREVELGGPIHSKGVFILAGFLGARYAADRPLTLSASLVFEQSYSGVEGDSASSAELYSLLSALSGLPIKQSIAVTGSVSQHGSVQAIGGANEKVEGFFDVCRSRGLDGSQGVILPASNVKHLMLRDDVVEAVRGGRFHLWAVDHVDQGIEILTGVPAGERGPDGRWPEGTVNARVAARVAEMAERARTFAAPPKAEGPAGGSQP